MVERGEIELARLADGTDHLIEALIGPDRRTLIGDARQLQHQRLEFGLLARKRLLKLGCPRACLLGLLAKFGSLVRRRILEPCADGVPFRAKLVNFRLCRAHLGIQR